MFSNGSLLPRFYPHHSLSLGWSTDIDRNSIPFSHGFEFDISSAIFSSYNHCLRHEIFVLPKTFTRKNNTSKLLTETTRHDEKKFKDFHKVHVFFSSLLKLKRNFSVIFFINKYLPCRNNGLFTILVYTLLDKSFVKCYISDQTSVPIDYILRRSWNLD